MARVSLDKDRELAKQGLLRVSVVAELLGVAPKTINIWLKNETALKVRGVKYLEWALVRKTRQDDVLFLSLPVDSYSAHCFWTCKQQQLPAPTGTVSAIAHAVSVLEKVKTLLPSVKLAAYEKIDNFQTAENLAPQKVLELPHVAEETALSVPAEYKKAVPKKINKLAASDLCPYCPHSLSEFHLTTRCDFAKGTVAACKCPTGA